MRASCACGELVVEPTAAPYAVVVCHCSWCRRRTGSAFGVGVYYRKDDVRLPSGAASFTRPAPEGRSVTNHFCRTCGTSLYWFSDLHPDGVAIALGAFEDPGAFTPQRSVWEESKAAWIAFPEAVAGLTQGRGSAPSR